jgi:hypothetical protein
MEPNSGDHPSECAMALWDGSITDFNRGAGFVEKLEAGAMGLIDFETKTKLRAAIGTGKDGVGVMMNSST